MICYRSWQEKYIRKFYNNTRLVHFKDGSTLYTSPTYEAGSVSACEDPVQYKPLTNQPPVLLDTS